LLADFRRKNNQRDEARLLRGDLTTRKIIKHQKTLAVGNATTKNLMLVVVMMS